MIMFLTPRKTPLTKEKDAAALASKAVRTIPSPVRQSSSADTAVAQVES
jgi:translation initiation factor IF-3